MMRRILKNGRLLMILKLVSVDNLLEWQKSKDDKDVEQDRRLNEHDGLLGKIERANFIKDRI